MEELTHLNPGEETLPFRIDSTDRVWVVAMSDHIVDERGLRCFEGVPEEFVGKVGSVDWRTLIVVDIRYFKDGPACSAQTATMVVVGGHHANSLRPREHQCLEVEIDSVGDIKKVDTPVGKLLDCRHVETGPICPGSVIHHHHAAELMSTVDSQLYLQVGRILYWCDRLVDSDEIQVATAIRPFETGDHLDLVVVLLLGDLLRGERTRYRIVIGYDHRVIAIGNVPLDVLLGYRLDRFINILKLLKS
ncbi:hypothetical protein PPL_11310 [Heterostelium album PN500]|uniref:Uncharacterized protein n=1 Tax=Heterostelium pallidum (strain ATCC 26659 / Pp 5 / PN500) TaxID=670386 RepID=D3BU49_HETP5|nr:hypothetical protein PPL_11310 [Heterostelium album PN500]EFA75235.1 hypothetical protein PPL_11310 [Heterostelium album PN500]|eukprot:XP_020427369.1 hypothetical protein PPL_11310 [Heterostelium album PN500]